MDGHTDPWQNGSRRRAKDTTVAATNQRTKQTRMATVHSTHGGQTKDGASWINPRHRTGSDRRRETRVASAGNRELGTGAVHKRRRSMGAEGYQEEAAQ